MQNYSFVVDEENKPLAPTKVNKAWFLIRNGEKHIGYVTALYPELNALNFQSPTKHCKKVNAQKCKLLWKYDKIYWLDCQCLSIN